MKHNYCFSILRVNLTPLEQKDIEKLRLLRNREARFFLNTNYVSKEAQKMWFSNYLKKEDDIMFKISKIDNPDEFIGAVAAYNIDFAGGSCEIGRIMIDKKVSSEKGIGTDAMKAICSFCFSVLKLNKVYCVSLKTNYRILTVEKRVGFKIVREPNDKTYLLEIDQEALYKNLI